MFQAQSRPLGRVGGRLALTLALASGSAAPVLAKDCLGAIRPALLRGGFSGGVRCKADHIVLRSAGTAALGQLSYGVYPYAYRFRAAETFHGGQRVILIDRAGKYVGRYSLSPPPQQGLFIDGSDIFVGPPWTAKSVIRIGRDGPPKQVLLNGVPSQLYY